MEKLSIVDKGFLLSESREMPMHVGGVSLWLFIINGGHRHSLN